MEIGCILVFAVGIRFPAVGGLWEMCLFGGDFECFTTFWQKKKYTKFHTNIHVSVHPLCTKVTKFAESVDFW